MIAALLVAWAQAQECPTVAAVPDSVQVAWLSPVARRVGAHAPLDVVQAADLQKLIQAKNRDATAVLRALGMVGPREEPDQWKVVVFDVKREWLCRPSEGDTTGVPRCEDTSRERIHRKAWTGCGFVQDVVTGERTLDIYRIDWSTAATQGFCVLPLGRFLEGRR